MPFFSLCCPTRDRVYHIERLLGSLTKNTFDYNNFEILFACDEDDIITQSYLENCKTRVPFSLAYYIREQTDFLNRDYFNWLSTNYAQGEFHWVIGDDVLFVKKHWDTYLLERINNFFSNKRDRVLYINVKDNSISQPDVPRYACFPIMSKEAIETIGFFMPPTIPSWSSDYAIYQAYAHPVVQRILEIEDLLLEHISPHADRIEENEFTQRQRDIYSKYNVKAIMDRWELDELPEITRRLREHIQRKER